MNEDIYFKGWARPGIRPVCTGDVPPLAPDETLDALSGWFKIFQLKKGHRFSTDDLLTAWYGTTHCPSAHRVLDLGSGIGTVGMVAAWRLVGASIVTVEAQEDSVRLARKSAQLNGLTHRYDIRLGDFRDEAVVAPHEHFDLIMGSPPYFPLDSGLLGDHPQKVACRFEMRGTIADYCLTAAKHLDAGGVFACVFPLQPPHQHERVRQGASEAALSVVRYRPIVLREGEPPLLGVFLMMRREHLPETFRDRTFEEPPLVIRCTDGTIHPEYAAAKLAIGFPP